MSLVSAMQKEQVVAPAKLARGVYVIPHEKDSYYGEVPLMTQVREAGYCGTVQYVDSSGTVCSVIFPENDITAPNVGFNYGQKGLRIITKEEADVIMAKMKKNSDEAIKRGVEELNKQISVKRLPVDEREDFDIMSKRYLNTTSNFVKLHASLKADKTPLNGGASYPHAVCCALTKTHSNIEVFIPKGWINYYGYNLVDLKMWIKFISELGTGFSGHILEEMTLSEAFPGGQIVNQLPRMASNNLYILKEMPVYRVLIETQGSNKGDNMVNYLHFILVRYMYNLQYWNIPTVAMQIKRGCGDSITNWEALLVAHMNFDYYDYYALVSNQGGRVALPSKENLSDVVIDKLRNSSNMVSSFVYTVTKDLKEVREAIKNKNYEFLLEAIKNWRGK
jgi:hypothetical protein